MAVITKLFEKIQSGKYVLLTENEMAEIMGETSNNLLQIYTSNDLIIHHLTVNGEFYMLTDTGTSRVLIQR
ncbi:hypothetical protein [Xenorhabdus khoisanae]|nr:hypothetical protein [Xenorhabdus khoisanae]